MAGTFSFSCSEIDPLDPLDDIIGEAYIYTAVNITINVSLTFDEFDPATDTIQSIEITSDPNDTGIILVSNFDNLSGSANISGQHTLELFTGSEIKYLPKGGTDRVDPVSVASNVANVPENKDVFSVKSDPAQEKIVTYTVTATSTEGSIGSVSYEYIAKQDYSAMRDWLNSYEL